MEAEEASNTNIFIANLRDYGKTLPLFEVTQPETLFPYQFANPIQTKVNRALRACDSTASSRLKNFLRPYNRHENIATELTLVKTHGLHKLVNYILNSVATSPVVLRWLYDSPRTGCALRTKLYISGAKSHNRVVSSGDLYCCLLPQREALCTSRSGFPIATIGSVSPWNCVWNCIICPIVVQLAALKENEEMVLTAVTFGWILIRNVSILCVTTWSFEETFPLLLRLIGSVSGTFTKCSDTAIVFSVVFLTFARHN